MSRIQVVYLAGYARCGSTLLGRLLGDLPNSIAVGEAAAHFFRVRQMIDNPCGCGSSVKQCPFWQDIDFFVGMDSFDQTLFRFRSFPFLGIYNKYRKKEITRLVKLMSSLYEKIARKTGANIIIDSSKTPQHAWLLSCIPEIELSIIHLVRDPHGVVSSYRRPKGYLPRLSALDVTAGWVGLNLACERLQERTLNYRRVRYEDFVAAPRALVAETAKSLGCDGNLEDFVGDHAVELRSQHMLGGNPDKLNRGKATIEVRPVVLSRTTRLLVSVATAPLVWYYGGSQNKPIIQTPSLVQKEVAGMQVVSKANVDE